MSQVSGKCRGSSTCDPNPMTYQQLLFFFESNAAAAVVVVVIDVVDVVVVDVVGVLVVVVTDGMAYSDLQLVL